MKRGNMYVHVEEDGFTVTFGCTDVFVSWDEMNDSDIRLDSDFALAVELAEEKLDYSVYMEEARAEGLIP